MTIATSEQNRPIHVLMIDDSEADCAYFEFLLKKKDASGLPSFSFESAHTGHEGLERLDEVLPDLLILDLNLPDMDGETLLHEILHSKPSFNPERILIASGEALPYSASQSVSKRTVLEKTNRLSSRELKEALVKRLP